MFHLNEQEVFVNCFFFLVAQQPACHMLQFFGLLDHLICSYAFLLHPVWSSYHLSFDRGKLDWSETKRDLCLGKNSKGLIVM